MYRSLTQDGKFDGIPRPLTSAYAFYLTSDCTGPYVSTDPIVGPMSFTYFGTSNYINNKVFTSGTKANSPEQLYRYENSCLPYNYMDYYTFTEVPASQLPPTLASPIRLSFN
jgi:hypothetical protein